MQFRDLRADEIEVRVQQAKQTGLILLLYKDSRVDQRILDETVGPECWQKRFYEHKGTLFCEVGIRIGFQDSAEWVWKGDAGSPSNMEAVKGEASDAFKRACFNWGIGRELYTSPFIWVNADKANIKQNGQKFQCFDHFSVEKIKIENGEIVGLAIRNDTKNCRAFLWQREGAK